MSDIRAMLRSKTRQMIDFLLAVGELRSRRVPNLDNWGAVWFHSLPADAPEVVSPFLQDDPEAAHAWLEIRKPREPVRPVLPESLGRWVAPPGLDEADQEPQLSERITVLVEREVPNPAAARSEPAMVRQRVPQELLLSDHPELLTPWRSYLETQWKPWAERWKKWERIQNAYESLDAMRRRIEEAGERHELRIALGLLQWRDGSGTRVYRHVLTAPAEFSFEASRGRIEVQPATDFHGARIELDMLDHADRPARLKASLSDQLEQLDVELWKKDETDALLEAIGNNIRADTHVRPRELEPEDRSGEIPMLSLAPAILLRERRPTAFQEVLQQMQESEAKPTEQEGSEEWEASEPWRCLIAEGDGVEPPHNAGSGTNGGTAGTEERVLFPLPTNDEQRRIVDQHARFPGVLVQGPPGTGKSHTIANLISHLLARGERVLVTAHGPRALEVLRHKLPPGIRELCVSALGSSREEQKDLETSIRRILHRRTTWEGREKDKARLEDLERKLTRATGDLAATERKLREHREAETYDHDLPGGYRGTAARIARQIQEDRDENGWLEGRVPADCVFPLEAAEQAEFRAEFTEVNPDVRHDLELWPGPEELPTAIEFAKWASEEKRLSDRSAEVREGIEDRLLESLRPLDVAELRAVQATIRRVEDLTDALPRVLTTEGTALAQDLLHGTADVVQAHLKTSSAELGEIEELRTGVAPHDVRVPPEQDPAKVELDARRLAAHLKGGGGRGFLFVRPRIIRDTRYLDGICLVDGSPCREPGQLLLVAAHLEAARRANGLWTRWERLLATDPGTNELRLARIKEAIAFLTTLDEARSAAEHELDTLPQEQTVRSALAQPESRRGLLRVLKAAIAAKEHAQVRESLDRLDAALRASPVDQEPHAVVSDLCSVVAARASEGYESTLKCRAQLLQRRGRLQTYEDLLGRLDASAPGAAALVRDQEGVPGAAERLAHLPVAWHWASAWAWLKGIRSEDRYAELTLRADRLAERVRELTLEIASTRAWCKFLERLDEPTRQNLVAWQQAVEKIGKGTGKRAVRFRSEARRYLRRCLDAIPAWVMPLYKVWESVDPQSGLFDTVIVDEASQCGVDSLLLLYLAKKIIVVGDKMQVSPMMVGIREDELAHLAREHLDGFRFQAMFRPDQSLYHHAERAFGNIVALREHFRCVPEIIRFSNDLCYSDSPLIPLRQYPADRLPPVRTTFVPDGFREGKSSYVVNPIEAERIADAVEACIADDAYEGRTIGVIALQGHKQAELIESLLAKRIPPDVFEERKIRCGDPSTFQGDERDVVFLSMVAAPNAPSPAMTALHYQQRFNVAMSRAADQAWIFHSVKSEDLSPSCLRRKLLTFALDPHRADTGGIGLDRDALERAAAKGPRQPGLQPPPFDSWFEVDVALELLRREYRVTPQLEVAGKWIDLVVEGGEARLAVECDGDEWHGADRYEEDIGRQRCLERAGWRFVRVRESLFYANRERSIEDVVTACDELSIVPVTAVAEPAPLVESAAQEIEDDIQPSMPNGSQVVEAGSNETEDRVPAREGPIEAESAPEAALPPEASAPFGGYGHRHYPDPRRTTRESIREALLEIAQRDAPLPRSAMHRLYVEGCPEVQKLGRTIRQSLDSVLAGMLRAGLLEQESELGPRTPQCLILRLPGQPRVRSRPGGNRALEEIPPSEIELVMLQEHPGPSIPRGDDVEAVFRRVFDHYGMKRLTNQRRAFLQSVLEYVYPPAMGAPPGGHSVEET